MRRECGVNAVSTRHVRRAESGCLRVEKRATKRVTKRVTKRGVAGRPRRAGARARSPRRDADEACPPGVNAPARAASRAVETRGTRPADRARAAARCAQLPRSDRCSRARRNPPKAPAYARRPPHRRAAAPRSNDRHVGLRAADVLPIMARPSGGADDRLRGSARGTTPKPDPGNAGVGMRSAMSRPISARRRAAARLSVFPAPFDPRR